MAVHEGEAEKLQADFDAEEKKAHGAEQPVFKNAREEIEFEVKKSVIQDLNVDSLKGETGDVDDAGTAALKKKNSPLFHAIDAVSTDPKKAGINAETAAGLQIARETLDRSGIDENAAKQMAAIGAKTGGIHGVSADGELMHAEDEDVDV